MSDTIIIKSPFGELRARWEDETLNKIVFGSYVPFEGEVVAVDRVPEHAEYDVACLLAYFRGETEALSPLRCVPDGSSFQMKVWEATLDIPYGRTASYGEVAERIGMDPSASRAVGAALNQNPLPLIVPCHRIVSASGDLTGFGGGLPWKRALLGMEMPQIVLAL